MKEVFMDSGAACYRRFLNGDTDAIIDIIADYREGLVLFINGFVNDICTAEELPTRMSPPKNLSKARKSLKSALQYPKHLQFLLLKPLYSQLYAVM